MSDSIPIACNLPILARATRRVKVTGTIFAHATRVEELADGYEFFFDNDAAWIAKLAQFIQNEQRCCGFFLFELVVRPNQQPISLKLRGDVGVKSFIQQFLPKSVEVSS